MPRCLVRRRGYSYVNDSASIAPGVFTTVYELRRGFMTLANIISAVFLRTPVARRGRMGSYQLSVFGFQIAQYSVEYE